MLHMQRLMFEAETLAVEYGVQDKFVSVLFAGLILENSDYDDRINSNGYVKISKGKFYQIIPDIVVYNSKNRPVIVTIGVGAKVKGISDRNYLNSFY